MSTRPDTSRGSSSAISTASLLLDQLITDRVGLDDVNEAFAALRAADGTRTVVTFPTPGRGAP